MSTQYLPVTKSVAHMVERRHQKHAAAVQWRKLWRALESFGLGWHPDTKAARLRMRECIAAARSYRKGQKHYAAIARITS